MAKPKKTLTIFLLVISILLLSLTTITIFFFQKERGMRKEAEAKLSVMDSSIVKVEDSLKEAKQQAYLFEEKNKEAEETNNNLMDDLELEKGLRKQTKEENAKLKELLDGANEAKELLSADLKAMKGLVASLEKQLNEKYSDRSSVEKSSLELKGSPLKQQNQEKGEVEKKEESILAGKILSTNLENNFVIFNLGEKDGMKADTIMSIYRREKYLGDVAITRVQNEMSVADVVPPLTIKQIKKEDKVVVKE